MDPTQAQAREAFQRGLEQANNLQWSEASESFERSYQLYPRPQTLFNLGLAYRALGRYREGTETLERYLRDANVPPDLRAQVDEALAEMRRSVARITLNVVPANATVTVDEQPVRAGEELLLNPGNHTLGARAEGYANYARTLTVTRGETRHFDVNLDRRGGSVATQWWFWTIIGVVVAGGVVGTAVAVTREGPANCGSLGVCLTPQ